MADRAYLNVQGLAHGRTGLERVAATAGDRDFLIVGMNVCFHGFILDLYPPGRCAERKGAYYPLIWKGLQLRVRHRASNGNSGL